MKTSIGLFIFFASLGGALYGCGSSSEPATAPNSTPPPTAPAAPAQGSSLTAGPYSVTIATEPPEPKVGTTKFTVEVSSAGRPAQGAVAKLSLSMPSMKMGGPQVDLKPTGDGKFEGQADLGMGGDYDGQITVTGSQGSGSATYQFKVNQ